MSLFCFLWVPLFYLFWRSIAGQGGSGGVWALLLGSISAVLQFVLGYLVSPGGFGFSRWLFGFVDIVSLPALVPLLVYAVLYFFRFFSGSADFANFALLWLIPTAALRAINWSSNSDPLLLVIVPLLWTAIVTGISFFINCSISRFRWYVLIPSALAVLALPLSAAASWWALFSHEILLGTLLFFASLLPMIVSTVLLFIRSE